MEIEQFYLGCLAHASYLIASDGVAAVVDPQRDVEIYIEEARKRNVRIEHVIETHLHADFVSGHRELAERTGARIYLGARAGALFPHVAVRDGDSTTFGSVKLTFLETPGHTLESICILVGDLDRSGEPTAVLTGDTLFIGDVGRPDLGAGHTPQELAGMLYDSIHTKLLTLPDAVTVYPAHGAGSLCGKNLSSDRSSTIGRERTTNYALRASSREEFVALLTADFPTRPEYFSRDVEINRQGAPALDQLKAFTALSADEVARTSDDGAIVLDVRDEDAFGAGHVPGSINIGLDGQFASWTGSMLGLDVDIVVVADDDEAARQSRTRLARVGIERVVGYLAGGVDAWRAAGKPVARIPQLDSKQLQALLTQGSVAQLIDVRRPPEWEGGVIGPALLRPLDRLSRTLDDLDKSRATVVYCKGGYRSSIAASILEREGFSNVSNARGGFDAWKEAGLPLEAATVAAR
jgi:glyoxylase-like metal-dependent hydrolase (beta-lactamase superfamily II)/rhodanese-related sulfurtransferase